MKILAAAFSTLLVLMLADAGLACSRAPGLPEPTDEDLFRSASAVFVAHLTRTEEAEMKDPDTGKPPPIVIGHFRLIETLKGSPPANGTVRDLVYGPGNCSLGLLAGNDYVFFLQDEYKGVVLHLSGSRMIFDLEARQVRAFLDKLRALR